MVVWDDGAARRAPVPVIVAVAIGGGARAIKRMRGATRRAELTVRQQPAQAVAVVGKGVGMRRVQLQEPRLVLRREAGLEPATLSRGCSTLIGALIGGSGGTGLFGTRL